uniref:Chromosome partition protein Smc n=1 Tax=Candidatus Kentrum sp. SD TaxID=2126332 RepID=A0A450Y4T6_9GAMM|nr:MAG: condensin subunit Smc [Candidatus Kentron sp. SD]VFK39642.1 MAG: condensin subunit Smc [Candidatus Kentron sp. SD]VFK78050.1 MAG: condensin subunit Smc [Candidatus Kentron sp. SD]
MFLHKIKLAGFKSFVDPTTVVLPSKLVGIVGPNGCGKSNVADAVRWVMGETSARHLRGDSMADVVFNGSAARKPVGQASVEILIDNTEENSKDKRLGGQYAAYDEISIRRKVSRDGQSVYYLNGRRCRRKDVTDVFLGTGLGPRSYAIIEQGTVSRLVEAKPDELREFLEEAAGVSKYKERRRETENRIRHTQENLNRLQDLRDELGRNLQHLARQASSAEKYKVLKQEERLRRVQLSSLHWRAFSNDLSDRDRQIGAREGALTEGLENQRHLESLLETRRAEHATAMNEFNDGYRALLDAGAEIARGEETLQNLRERATQTEKTLHKELEAFKEARDHLKTEQENIGTLKETLDEKEPALAELQRAETETADEHAKAETAMQEWSLRWESIGLRVAEAMRTVQAEEGRIAHLKERLAHSSEQYVRLQKEQDKLDPRGLRQNVEDLAIQLRDQDAIRLQAESEHQTHQVIVQDLRQRIRELSGTINTTRERFQEARGRLSSLKALQQEALGKGEGAVTDWLRKSDLIERPRLAEKLQVVAGWEQAVESVLGTTLRAVCVDELDTPGSMVADLREGAVTLFQMNADTEKAMAPPPDGDPSTRLTQKISAPWPVDTLFAGIHVAEDLGRALALRPELGWGESIVVRSGEWLGPDWLRIHRGVDPTAGVLPREREINTLSEVIETLRAEIDNDEAAMETAHLAREVAEEEQSGFQSRIAEAKRIHATLKSRLDEQRRRLDEAVHRSQVIARELAELREQRQQARSSLEEMQQGLQEQKANRDQLIGERDQQATKRKQYQEHLNDSRLRWRGTREESHRLAVEMASIRARYDSLIQAGSRNHDQVARLEIRCDELRRTLTEMDDPLGKSETELTERRARRQELDTILQDLRRRVEELDAAIRDADQKRHAISEQIESDRAALEQMRLARQEVHVRREAIEEQVTASGHAMTEILDGLPDQANKADWELQIGTLEQKISRLGTVNLAAVEEHAKQMERKNYLDTQYQDLVDALATLQEAISDIDKETRNRFTDTYEKVNMQLGILFPRLFGGGHAHLELTDSDPLNAGVTVMARPPGKRNSTIALLSGGEKALTAVALVFALFELNPAPFCLLDEVDAPLDDANVDRFRDLVRDMSQRIQFMIITHNKNTMEIANHLIGVTMGEPGISRLVTVDVENAVAMAEA